MSWTITQSWTSALKRSVRFAGRPAAIRNRVVAASAGLLASFALGAAPPANDNFADRLVLSGTEIGVQASNVGATREPGEPAGLEETVWSSWTAPTDGLTQIILQGGFAPTFGVWTGGQLEQLTLVTNSTPLDFSFKSAIFEVIAG